MVAVYTLYGLEGGALPPRPGVGLGGLVPRAASAVLGGLVPCTESAVLGGLLFSSADYCDFRTHGPHMRIDDLSAPSGRFVARVSASVTTVDRCPSRGRTLPAADNGSLRSSPYPPRSAWAPQKPLLPRRPSSTRLLQRSPTQGTDAVETTGPTASAPASPGSPAPRR